MLMRVLFTAPLLPDSIDLSPGVEVQSEDGYPGYFENDVEVSFLPAGTQETSGTIPKKVEMKSILAKLRIHDLNSAEEPKFKGGKSKNTRFGLYLFRY